MAYEDNQNDFPLPGGKKSPKKGAEFLPKYFRTESNRKFLDATIDQFNSDGVAEKIDAFVGKREAKAVNIDDNECGYWGYSAGDYNQDCSVDINDLAFISSNWLNCTTPGEIGCFDAR